MGEGLASRTFNHGVHGGARGKAKAEVSRPAGRDWADCRLSEAHITSRYMPPILGTVLVQAVKDSDAVTSVAGLVDKTFRYFLEKNLASVGNSRNLTNAN